jgi:hypothetical protein
MDDFDYSLGLPSTQTAPAAGGGIWESLGTQLAGIAGGYLSRRVDIDLQGRYAQAYAQGGTVGLNGVQRPIFSGPNGAPLFGTGQAGAFGSMGLLLPLAVVGLGAFLLLRR